LPSALQFTEGHTSEYLYDAAGVKRKVKQVTTTGNLMVPMGSMLSVPADKVAVTTQTDYCGNVIYENGTLSKIQVDGGHITMSGGKISKASESYRATSQVNKLNKAGGNYISRIVENIPVGKGAREKALKLEKEITNRNKGSINPDLHRRPRPE